MNDKDRYVLYGCDEELSERIMREAWNSLPDYTRGKPLSPTAIGDAIDTALRIVHAEQWPVPKPAHQP